MANKSSDKLFLAALKADGLQDESDVHNAIARRLTGSFQIDKKTRNEYKIYSFHMRYGAFQKVPDTVRAQYRIHFPAFVRLGKKVKTGLPA